MDELPQGTILRGLAITKELPQMPILRGGAQNWEAKNQRIIDKLTAFFYKYYNIWPQLSLRYFPNQQQHQYVKYHPHQPNEEW